MSKDIRKKRTPITNEHRETSIISDAIALAEKQIRDGTASSQVLTHFLKLATEERKLEKEILEKQALLLEAKTNALNRTSDLEGLYKEAINAVKKYRGIDEDEDDDNTKV